MQDFGGDDSYGDMDDYGDDYGCYGDEKDAFDQALKGASNNFGGFEEFGANDGEGYGHRTADDQNQEEERLIGHLVASQRINVTKRDYLGYLMK